MIRRAGALSRRDFNTAGTELTAGDVPLPYPGTVQGNQLPVGNLEIHGGAHGLFQHHFLIPALKYLALRQMTSLSSTGV